MKIKNPAACPLRSSWLDYWRRFLSQSKGRERAVLAPTGTVFRLDHKARRITVVRAGRGCERGGQADIINSRCLATLGWTYSWAS
jgi:hypothetical protein